MKDLAEVSLELLINACEAHATEISFDLFLDPIHSLIITDNGNGISKEDLKEITSPFKTSRTTRKLGFGLAFFAQAIQQASGEIDIQSEVNIGTIIKAKWDSQHIDALAIGNLGESIALVLQRNPDVDFTFTLHKLSSIQTFRSREVKEAIHPLSINEIEILKWIEEHINSLFYLERRQT